MDRLKYLIRRLFRRQSPPPVSTPVSISFMGTPISGWQPMSEPEAPEPAGSILGIPVVTTERPIVTQEITLGDWSAYIGRIPMKPKIIEDATVIFYRTGIRAALYRRLGAILGVDRLYRRGVIERTGVTVSMKVVEDDE